MGVIKSRKQLSNGEPEGHQRGWWTPNWRWFLLAAWPCVLPDCSKQVKRRQYDLTSTFGGAQHSPGYIFGKKVDQPCHGTTLRAQPCIFLGNQKHWELLFSFTSWKPGFEAADVWIVADPRWTPSPDLPGATVNAWGCSTYPSLLQLHCHTVHACCLPFTAHSLAALGRIFGGKIRQRVIIVLSNWVDKIRCV